MPNKMTGILVDGGLSFVDKWCLRVREDAQSKWLLASVRVEGHGQAHTRPVHGAPSCNLLSAEARVVCRKCGKHGREPDGDGVEERMHESYEDGNRAEVPHRSNFASMLCARGGCCQSLDGCQCLCQIVILKVIVTAIVTAIAIAIAM